MKFYHCISFPVLLVHLSAGFEDAHSMNHPLISVRTWYTSEISNPCNLSEFYAATGYPLRLYCEYNYPANVDITAVSWYRVLPDGTRIGVFANGVQYHDKELSTDKASYRRFTVNTTATTRYINMLSHPVYLVNPTEMVVGFVL